MMEESTLRTVLSLLTIEESSARLTQPVGVGRRPANVSSESMSVNPDNLKPGKFYLIKKYLAYQRPPRGFAGEDRDPKDKIVARKTSVSSCPDLKDKAVTRKTSVSSCPDVSIGRAICRVGPVTKAPGAAFRQ